MVLHRLFLSSFFEKERGIKVLLSYLITKSDWISCPRSSQDLALLMYFIGLNAYAVFWSLCTVSHAVSVRGAKLRGPAGAADGLCTRDPVDSSRPACWSSPGLSPLCVSACQVCSGPEKSSSYLLLRHL